MNVMDYWTLFMETGAPEAYLMYRKQQKMEGKYVSDDPGHRSQGNGLQ
jgi:hypothetical protein